MFNEIRKERMGEKDTVENLTLNEYEKYPSKKLKLWFTLITFIMNTMNIQIIGIALTSNKPTFDNYYFKVDANAVFVSKVMRNDKVE